MKIPVLLLTASALLAATSSAQPGHPGDSSTSAATAPRQPESKRVGDPYPLGTCPISGKELGAMGDPAVKIYGGREVRFCCPMCIPEFEKNVSASLAKVDEKIIKDQASLYPLKTSLVSGLVLPTAPFEFVFGNRLVRVGAESERAEFLKDPAKYLAALDQAVVAVQGKDYALKTCPVSKEELDGEMGKPVDMVVGGRLIRLCCAECEEDVLKAPVEYIAKVDAARQHGQGQPDGRKHGDGHQH